MSCGLVSCVYYSTAYVAALPPRLASPDFYTRLVAMPRVTKMDGSEKKRPTVHPTPRAVHGQRCLHGLYHGSQWPWLTSGMQAASPDIARARRAPNHLHSLVSLGGASNSHCFLFGSVPP